MEYIDRIFYRKINPSDFKKLYDIDKPEGGGGQTYLEAAGISNEKIVDFLSYAEVEDSPLPGETRSVYTFNAYVLGDPKKKCSFVEFAPRKGRNNYRISRQNMKYKHPAWSLENGFPEPSKDATGEYTSEGDFAGIIDNLVIFIIRTTYRHYYASFINTATMPDSWPQNIGLEGFFSGERRDVINMDAYKLCFVNDADNPFGDYVPTIVESNRLVNGCNVLLYGVPGSGKSWTIEHEYCNPGTKVERLVFHPDYTNADFIGQILPVVDEDKQVTYEFVAGPFTNILKAAYSDPTREYVLIIEEINRGNAPAIFGDIFQLLDRTVEPKRDLEEGITYPKGTSEYGISNENIAAVVYGDKKHKIRIPSNLSILGTMNTSDQNVFTLDTAFQRRWKMRLIENNFDNVRDSLANAEILDTGVTWSNFCDYINRVIVGNKSKVASAEDKRLGVYFIHEDDLKENKDAKSQHENGLLAEYKELLKVERESNLTQTQKERLGKIRKALMDNRVFPEKVIKYLWDDAFKFTPEAIFDTDNLNSLEEVIQKFVFAEGYNRFDIFNQTVRDSLRPKN